MSQTWKRVTLVLCAVFLAQSGCSRKPKEPFTRQPTYSVRGQLLVQGQPAGGVQLIFNPSQLEGWEGPFPVAFTEPDGSFQVQTYGSADGAPAGTYAVTAIWLTPGEQEERPDLLQGRYASMSTTPVRVEVQAQENQLQPISLQ